MSRAACWSAFGAAAIAMSWPMVIAGVVLRYALVRPYVVNEAAIVAYPISVCVAALGAVVSAWRPPEDDAAWVIRCSLLGALTFGWPWAPIFTHRRTLLFLRERCWAAFCTPCQWDSPSALLWGWR